MSTRRMTLSRYGTEVLPPRLRNIKIACIGNHHLIKSKVTASYRGMKYETRCFFCCRGEDGSWALRCYCECKNGPSSRYTHAVATLLLTASLQNPEDMRIPWNTHPPARPILSNYNMLLKRKSFNPPLTGPLAGPVTPKRRRTNKCSQCSIEGHNIRKCTTIAVM